MAEFPTFAMLAQAALRPVTTSELREKQLAEARERTGALRDVLIDTNCDENDDNLAFESYSKAIGELLPQPNANVTAAARAFSSVVDTSRRFRDKRLCPGGLGLDQDDYFAHLLVGLTALDIAVAIAIRSQPEPTIAA